MWMRAAHHDRLVLRPRKNERNKPTHTDCAGSHLLKEKLLSKLQTGNITTFLGIGLLICAIYIDLVGGMNSNDLRMLYLAGAILLSVGIAFLISYSKGKKMLAKEMEAEQAKLLEQA